MDTFKFQIPKKKPRPKPDYLNITIQLKGELQDQFEQYVAKCQEFCTLNHAEVVRQMVEFCLRNLNQKVPVDVGDCVNGNGEQKDSFSISTQP